MKFVVKAIKNRSHLMFVVFLCGVLYTDCTVFSNGAEEEDKKTSVKNLNGKQNQIDFTVSEVSLKTLEGKTISLKNYRSTKIVHLVFCVTSQPTCIEEIQKLGTLHQVIRDEPYEILAIFNGQFDSLKGIKEVQKNYQLPYKILFDEDGRVFEKYGVMGVPTHIVISKEGQVMSRFLQLHENFVDFIAQFFLP